ncbi:MAG: DUF4340 domain-containing protein [bacterium]|nr:MAG: DUF4340 domain-containing protein [bacterium]
MKFKREYLFLAVIIVALVVYLIFKNTDRTHYSLPELPGVNQSEITRIAIQRGDSIVTLERRDERWLIQPQGYPADKGKVDKILEAAAGLSLSTLVSESKSYTQYELTDETRIGIEAFRDDVSVRKFDIGKVASTYRHTFVRLEGDHRVYQARDDIRRPFDYTIDKLRDNVAMKYDRDSVTGITVTGTEGSLTLTKNDTAMPVTPPIGADSIQSEPPPKWQAADGRAADEQTVDRIVISLSNLTCDGYIIGKTKEDFSEPIYTVTVGVAEPAILSIFEKGEDDKYPAVSNQNDYPFWLPEWRVKQIMKEPAEIMGEKPEK